MGGVIMVRYVLLYLPVGEVQEWRDLHLWAGLWESAYWRLKIAPVSYLWFMFICLVLTMAHLRVFPRVPSRFPPGSTQKMWISSLKIGWQISARTLLRISHQQLIHGNVSNTDTQAPAIKLAWAESEHLTIFFLGYWLDIGAIWRLE